MQVYKLKQNIDSSSQLDFGKHISTSRQKKQPKASSHQKILPRPVTNESTSALILASSNLRFFSSKSLTGGLFWRPWVSMSMTWTNCPNGWKEKNENSKNNETSTVDIFVPLLCLFLHLCDLLRSGLPTLGLNHGVEWWKRHLWEPAPIGVRHIKDGINDTQRPLPWSKAWSKSHPIAVTSSKFLPIAQNTSHSYRRRRV